MNTSELIDKIASESGFSKADAARALNAITDTIIDAMANGNDVQLTDFGNFVVRNSAAGAGLVSIQSAESKVEVFNAGKILKQAIS